jgi:hypothetical protein
MVIQDHVVKPVKYRLECATMIPMQRSLLRRQAQAILFVIVRPANYSSI